MIGSCAPWVDVPVAASSLSGLGWCTRKHQEHPMSDVSEPRDGTGERRLQVGKAAVTETTDAPTHATTREREGGKEDRKKQGDCREIREEPGVGRRENRTAGCAGSALPPLRPGVLPHRTFCSQFYQGCLGPDLSGYQEWGVASC